MSLNTYLDHYLYYSSENEASPRYHKWACLMTLAVAMSRRVWVAQGDWKVFPNLYMLFVGDPASGKSIAMSFAEKLVQAFTAYPIAPNSITREMLSLTMAKGDKSSFMHNNEVREFTHMTIFSDELVMFLGAEPVRMIDFLTAIYNYDGIFQVATKNKGTDTITNPCLCLLGLLTPSYLNAMLTQNLVSGGFSRRVLMIYAKDRGNPKPRPVFNETHAASKQWCVAYAKKLQQVCGPFVWTPQAEEWFDNWYITVKDPTMRAETNGVMKAFWTARDTLMLKIAMLYGLSQRPELILTVDSLIYADILLTEITPDILAILGGGGRNELAPITHQIYQYISDNPNVKETQIRAKFLNNARDSEIHDMLTHLQETGRIKRTQTVNASNGLITSTYCVTAVPPAKAAT